MRPTSWRLLLGWTVAGVLVGYVGARALYGDLPRLPVVAPVSLGLLALVEFGMAKAVHDRMHRRARPTARPLHPEQIARAGVLAKASSPTGAVLAGTYAGLLVFLLRSQVAAAADDEPVAVVSIVASVALVVAALVLERACRLPAEPQARAHGWRRELPD
ncbi:MAG: hypothetical protein JWL64_924 [Frankiales bacterium]|nr:hypothetical protein [Frankiales bacterium]